MDARTTDQQRASGIEPRLDASGDEENVEQDCERAMHETLGDPIEYFTPLCTGCTRLCGFA